MVSDVARTQAKLTVAVSTPTLWMLPQAPREFTAGPGPSREDPPFTRDLRWQVGDTDHTKSRTTVQVVRHDAGNDLSAGVLCIFQVFLTSMCYLWNHKVFYATADPCLATLRATVSY